MFSRAQTTEKLVVFAAGIIPGKCSVGSISVRAGLTEIFRDVQDDNQEFTLPKVWPIFAI